MADSCLLASFIMIYVAMGSLLSLEATFQNDRVAPDICLLVECIAGICFDHMSLVAPHIQKVKTGTPHDV